MKIVLVRCPQCGHSGKVPLRHAIAGFLICSHCGGKYGVRPRQRHRRTTDAMMSVTDKRFGALVVTGFAAKAWSGDQYRAMVRCRCDCGAECIKRVDGLKAGHIKDCGKDCALRLFDGLIGDLIRAANHSPPDNSKVIEPWFEAAL